jgi:hypothetical protein
MKTIAFFNNKGGVGKTSLVYHLAWLYADRGIKVLVADLDPQANFSAMFLDDERLVQLWDDGEKSTVIDSLQPLIDRTGDIAAPHVEMVARNIGLVAGNLALSRFEDLLSENWPKRLGGDLAAFRVITAFHRIMRRAAENMKAELILINVGPQPRCYQSRGFDRGRAGSLAVGAGFVLVTRPSQSWAHAARVENGLDKAPGRAACRFGNRYSVWGYAASRVRGHAAWGARQSASQGLPAMDGSYSAGVP